MDVRHTYSLRITGGVTPDPIDKEFTAFSLHRVDADEEAKDWAARVMVPLFPCFYLGYLYGRSGDDTASVHVATFRAEVTVREASS